MSYKVMLVSPDGELLDSISISFEEIGDAQYTAENKLFEFGGDVINQIVTHAIATR